MREVEARRTCVLLTALLALFFGGVDARTFTLGYLTGSKRRPGDLEYQRPGYRISGAINLAVEEVNAGELAKRGHKLDFIVAETYGEEETSILMTADLWTKNVSAYIGPQETCIHEGRMAAAFNIPMISYFCTHRETSDKSEFPTFARTRPPDTQISKSVVSVLLAFNWTKVTFMYMNSSLFEFNKMSTVAETILSSFEASGITLNSLRCWGEPFHHTHMHNPFHQHVQDTYKETRIYVILGNYYDHIGLLMALDKKKLLEKGNYWVLGVDLEEYDEKSPDKYLRGLLQDRTNLAITQAFRSYFSIVASPPVNFENFTRVINKYRRKPPFNFTNPLAIVGGVVQIVPETAYLYDAVHLYERSLLQALDEGRDPGDGRGMVAALHGVHYRSAMGYMVYMDENGDAEGNYTLIAFGNNPENGEDRFGLYPIGYFVGKEEKSGLPRLQVTEEIHWIGGTPPIAEPYCGYHGEKCTSHTGEIVGGVAGGILLILTAIALVLYRNWRYEQELDSLLWKVNYKEIQIKEQSGDENSDQKSGADAASKNNKAGQPVVRTSQVSLSSNPDADFRYSTIFTQIGVYKGRIYAIKKVRKKSIEISREMKKELKMMRDLRHDNLNAFIGACTDPPNICIVAEYCTRGSLKDILDNEDVKLDNMFIASLVGDIIRGMIYLHESPIRFHGALSTSNCLVDSRWVVKLTDFGLREFKRDAECEPADIFKKYEGLLYRAPELLRSSQLKQPSIRDYQKGDVYSFGIVLYEIQGRHGPFGITDLSAPEILKRIITREPGKPPYRPPFDKLENSFDFVRDCLVECWAENPDDRPEFKVVRNKLRPLKKGMKPNIFDNMMAMMEKYANNLEVLVDERTDQLIEEKKKTDALLYEMLPRYVAEQLKRGHKVEAEGFDCVTIYFSDIVGFTSMSAESTPLQVVDFLNDLYTCFDSTIENYDVYKVETIGDAYMVVSGLPIRNGCQHAGEVATMSLYLLNAIKQFPIRHRPLDKLQLRIGIHSGPVCAGVVGLKMPRYCLFGDTVNTASRMESTGLPLKIHCSWETKRLLDELGGFNLVERGVVSMKGKGERLTYWLIGEDPFLREQRSKERAARRSLTSGGLNKTAIGECSVPRSSLKNKSLARTTFLRCSSESPKRLRFASSDQLDQQTQRSGSRLESIADNSPCKRRPSCAPGGLNCIESMRSASTSCPCVEKLCDAAPSSLQVLDTESAEITTNKMNGGFSLTSSVPALRGSPGSNRADIISHGATRNFRFKPSLGLQMVCRSAPSSPRHSSLVMEAPRRNTQSTEEIDGWDSTPLIYSSSQCPD
ncbi:guanylate cyclase 32E isoform X3 [Athalia rosae]|nr:guanylate cyclase 32E isoform X3 [Athalia rosae]XP_048510397.1 guanylate cyclase 32E isoform X3 [Athalia rosae]XP_048510398.1 guanylate cyclase 32E isoform X3 [Athalia rosae]XP_048510399.1 guanylate cyclase 32E isoform X3 [Athalia rosae]XP_048510400.1 guanylate cyclase 32E isoform X3 [Athalia rosae]XP_048510401.1 guanylate cyclase 32E isoform X3 [Athalia rosae]XP_048510402.1 guanylate cyclase 32E isoform X3 [Athalia rosae]